jgi:hypothetical protein
VQAYRDNPLLQARYVLPSAVAIFEDMVIVADSPKKEHEYPYDTPFYPTRLIEFKLSDGSFVRELPEDMYTDDGKITCMCFSADGSVLAVADQYENNGNGGIHLVCMDDNIEPEVGQVVGFQCFNPSGMVFMPDGKLAVAENGEGVRIYDTKGVPAAPAPGSAFAFSVCSPPLLMVECNHYCRGVALDPHGNILILDDSTVRVYSPAENRWVHNQLMGDISIKGGDGLAFDMTSGRVAVCCAGHGPGFGVHLLG